MRAFLIVAVLIGAVVAGYWFVNEAQAPVKEIEEGMSAIDTVLHATLQVPELDAVVTLKDGEAFFEIAPESVAQGSISLIPNTIAEWSTGARKDVSAAFAVNSGGSGVFVYMVLFDASGDTLVKKSEAYLGDRINITRVGVGELAHGDADYRITVQTLERKDGEAYASTPSVAKTRTLYVTDQGLEEIEPGRDDS